MTDDDIEESAHPTGRTSARGPRIELISRRERHRRWTPEQKQGIVEEFLAGARPTDVARKHEIGTGQLYTWRRLMLDGKLGGLPVSASSFARVNVVAPPGGETLDAPIASRAALAVSAATQAVSDNAAPPTRRGGIIEIELSCGTRVRVDAEVDARALGRVLSALGGR